MTRLRGLTWVISMKSFETILKRMREQEIPLQEGEKIVIPLDELYLELNGEHYPGRIFTEEGIIVTLQPFDDNYSETGFANHPVVWKIKNTYETWLSNGSISYRTEFYIVR